MQELPEDLVRAVRDRRAILFAGAGLSMCVGLPSWRVLIEHMVEELELDPACIEETTYQTLAEYYRLKQGSIGALRSWMDRNWSVPDEIVRASEIHRLIVELDFPIIYTTNYDRNLECAFQIHDKPFVKIANAKDIAKIKDSVTQIVKYHGDFDDDESLVLAETDYFQRLSFDSPLDIKFRADALGRTLLFIGYSMSDTNIRLLLHRLWETWTGSGYEDERPKSYAFMTARDPVQPLVLSRWGITALTVPREDPERSLREFLAALKERVDSA
jgi:SIR2-like domain